MKFITYYAKTIILIINIIALGISLLVNKTSALCIFNYSFKLELIIIGLLLGYISFFLLNLKSISFPNYITLIILLVNIINLLFLMIMLTKIFLSTHSVVFDGGWIKLIRLEWNQSELYQLSIELLRKLDLVLAYNEILYVIENSSNPEELEINFLKIKSQIQANIQNSKMENTQPNALLLKLGMILGLGRALTTSEFSSMISISLSIFSLFYGSISMLLFGNSSKADLKNITLKLEEQDKQITEIITHADGLNAANVHTNLKMSRMEEVCRDLRHAQTNQKNSIESIHRLLEHRRTENGTIANLLMATIDSTQCIGSVQWKFYMRDPNAAAGLRDYNDALEVLQQTSDTLKTLVVKLNS